MSFNFTITNFVNQIDVISTANVVNVLTTSSAVQVIQNGFINIPVPGPTGATGSQGPTGPTGPRGATGTEVTYTLPTATTTTLGGIKLGSGLSITDGVLSTNTTDDSTVVANITTSTVLDTWDKTISNTAKYLVRLTDSSSNFQTVEYVVTTDGTDIYTTEYGIIIKTSALGSFVFDMVGDAVRMRFTPVGGSTVRARIYKTLLAV
jgi:hypothetical protein